MSAVSAAILATNRLASFLAAVTYEQLPDVVRTYAKRCLLDSLGCAIGGSQPPGGRIALEVMGRPDSTGEALILASGQRVPVLNAAYANSYLASVLDFDDFHVVHPGVCAGPVAVTVADWLHATGRDLLRAVVLSYEMQLRVAVAIQPTRARWPLAGGCSTPQIFGPMAVAATLMRLTTDQVVNAFGLAAANAPVPHKTNRSIGGNPRPLSWVQGNPGWISMGGVLAAQMAQRGFRGRLEILDGELGFWAMAGSDQCNFDALTDGLGEDFEILRVAFKPYPCCRYIHSAAEALERVLAAHRIPPEAVQRIVVRSYPLLGAFMEYEPQTFVDGQFSVPYVLGLVLLGRPPGVGWLLQETLRDPQVLEAARKVEFEVDDAATEAFAAREYPATVSVQTAGGVLTERVETPRGDPRRPLSDVELEQKFRTLVAPVQGPGRADRLLEFVHRVETVDDVHAELTRIYEG